MYLASAVLKRFDDEAVREDLPLVHWGVQDSLHKAEQALDDLLRNFPNRFIAGAMRSWSSRSAVCIPHRPIVWITSWPRSCRCLPPPAAVWGAAST